MVCSVFFRVGNRVWRARYAHSTLPAPGAHQTAERHGARRPRQYIWKVSLSILLRRGTCEFM